jgi:hypothetical protein
VVQIQDLACHTPVAARLGGEDGNVVDHEGLGPPSEPGGQPGIGGEAWFQCRDAVCVTALADPAEEAGYDAGFPAKRRDGGLGALD